MAYEKIGWNDYDDDLSLEENIERHAVATDALLNRMDEGIAKANNVSVGTVETTDEPSVEIVENENGDGYTMNFGVPKGEKGDKGDQGPAGADGAEGAPGADGAAATITVGNVTTGEAGTDASVSNSGTENAAVLDFVIPRGADGAPGADGAAATVTVGNVTTGEAGTNAQVTNSGTTNAAIFDFVIPKGEKGDKGDKGDQGDPAAIKVGTDYASATDSIIFFKVLE